MRCIYLKDAERAIIRLISTVSIFMVAFLGCAGRGYPSEEDGSDFVITQLVSSDVSFFSAIVTINTDSTQTSQEVAAVKAAVSAETRRLATIRRLREITRGPLRAERCHDVTDHFLNDLQQSIERRALFDDAPEILRVRVCSDPMGSLPASSETHSDPVMPHILVEENLVSEDMIFASAGVRVAQKLVSTEVDRAIIEDQFASALREATASFPLQSIMVSDDELCSNATSEFHDAVAGHVSELRRASGYGTDIVFDLRVCASRYYPE